jgi:hypothetical protein
MDFIFNTDQAQINSARGAESREMNGSNILVKQGRVKVRHAEQRRKVGYIYTLTH